LTTQTPTERSDDRVQLNADRALQTPGIAGAEVAAWFAEHVPGVVPPLRFTRFPGGRSNLTYRVDDATGRRWVLRRPPLGSRLETAHDVGREQRVMQALHGSAVPVPRVLGSATQGPDRAPFFVMEYVDGLAVRDGVDAALLPTQARAAASTALVDVLAALHAVSPPAVGLGELGRGGGYVERQLARWHRQVHAAGRDDTARLDAVHERLVATVPSQRVSTLVHGDYRLDNCVLDRAGAVCAVLDWELCTVGDPLADLGLLLVYWSAAEDGLPLDPFPPTVLDGFATRDELARRYADRTGRDLSRLGYYTALGYWKIACILHGIRTRYAAGAMGDPDADPVGAAGPDPVLAAETADRLLDLATAALDAAELPSQPTRRSAT
jgi:aminoglycoside phosphotransferase (APT) family kinase protein